MKATIRKVPGVSPGFRILTVDGVFGICAWRRVSSIGSTYYEDAFGNSYNNAEAVKCEAINRVLERRKKK